jgi:hypothetical protein
MPIVTIENTSKFINLGLFGAISRKTNDTTLKSST